GQRAGDPGPLEAAVAAGDLVEVLLVVLLGVVEGPRGRDLGRHRPEPPLAQGRVVGRAGPLRLLALRVAGREDRRAVLGADVVALAHALGRIVLLEEGPQEVYITQAPRVEGDEHRLGVAGPARAHLLVGRVRRVAALVADGRRVDAVEAPEQALGAPEAAEREVGDLDPVREGRLDRRAEHGVALGDGEGGRVPARQGLSG